MAPYTDEQIRTAYQRLPYADPGTFEASVNLGVRVSGAFFRGSGYSASDGVLLPPNGYNKFIKAARFKELQDKYVEASLHRSDHSQAVREFKEGLRIIAAELAAELAEGRKRKAGRHAGSRRPVKQGRSASGRCCCGSSYQQKHSRICAMYMWGHSACSCRFVHV
jgi:hypothetical protein